MENFDLSRHCLGDVLLYLDPQQPGYCSAWIAPLGGHLGGQVDHVSRPQGVHRLLYFDLQSPRQQIADLIALMEKEMHR